MGSRASSPLRSSTQPLWVLSSCCLGVGQSSCYLAEEAVGATGKPPALICIFIRMVVWAIWCTLQICPNRLPRLWCAVKKVPAPLR